MKLQTNLRPGRVACPFFALLATAVAVFGADPAPPSETIDSMRSKYEEKLVPIEDEYRTKVRDLPDQYLASLSAFEKASQEKGELTGVLSSREEQKRFSEARTVAPENIADGCPDLADIQIKYMEYMAARKAEKNNKVVSLTEQYAKSLEEMEKDFTKKGQIDNAMLVRTERDHVLGGQVLSRAEFELAEVESLQSSLDSIKQKRKESASKPKPAPEPDSKPVVKETRGDSWGQDIGGADVQIYAEGKEPVGSGGKFRRANMTATDSGSTLQSTVVDVMVGKDFLYRKERDGDAAPPSRLGWNPHRFVTKHTRYNLRCCMGARIAGGEIKKPTLVVEYFVKPEVRSRDAFQRDATEVIRLPNLVAGSKTTVDTAGIVVEDGEYENRKTYSVDFYGVIVSIFDGSRNLVYQTVSSPDLKDLASPRMPDARLKPATPWIRGFSSTNSNDNSRFRSLGRPGGKDRLE